MMILFELYAVYVQFLCNKMYRDCYQKLNLKAEICSTKETSQSTNYRH